MCLQLFEKLKLQESSAGDQLTSKPEAGETASAHPPAHDAARRERSPSGAELSDRVRTQNQDPQKACETKDGKKYGKVHTRHINQLFIRGENVILVNPQRL